MPSIRIELGYCTFLSHENIYWVTVYSAYSMHQPCTRAHAHHGKGKGLTHVEAHLDMLQQVMSWDLDAVVACTPHLAPPKRFMFPAVAID